MGVILSLFEEGVLFGRSTSGHQKNKDEYQNIS